MADIASPASALAPFGGITRIRFKGSVAGATLSAIAAPPQYCFFVRIGLVLAKSIGTRNEDVRCQRFEDNAFDLITNLTRLYPAGDVGAAVTFESV
jgi:hypothetical protein